MIKFVKIDQAFGHYRGHSDTNEHFYLSLSNVFIGFNNSSGDRQMVLGEDFDGLEFW